jgi:hypothetical protein
MTRDHIISAPLATLLLPDPVHPGRHARFEMFKVVPASPPVFAVVDGKLRA